MQDFVKCKTSFIVSEGISRAEGPKESIFAHRRLRTDEEVVSTYIETGTSLSVADFLAFRTTFSCQDAVEKIRHCTLYDELRFAPRVHTNRSG